MNDFKEKLTEFSKAQSGRSDKCTNEEMTKQFLVLPFLNFLGYDIYDPEEVVPEYKADFSEKYKNKVDYAICKDNSPVIAIEVKSQGKKIDDDKGQLKRYFNAAKSVKLGILTDGSKYECYTDTDEPNMMDDTPFLSFDFLQVVSGEISETTLSGIMNLNKNKFNPENIGTEARSKFLMSSFINLLEKWSTEPSDNLIRLFLDESNIVNKRMTTRVLDENRRIVCEAMDGFIKSRILSKLGVSGNEVPKIESNNVVALLPKQAEEKNVNDIITTENERNIFDYCRRRLAFLIKDETLFREISNIEWRDYKTKFCVFYKKERTGSLFTLQEKKDGNFFVFTALGDKEISPASLSDIDQLILESFTKRVKENLEKAA
jgi:hypothetical protein